MRGRQNSSSSFPSQNSRCHQTGWIFSYETVQSPHSFIVIVCLWVWRKVGLLLHLPFTHLGHVGVLWVCVTECMWTQTKPQFVLTYERTGNSSLCQNPTIHLIAELVIHPTDKWGQHCITPQSRVKVLQTRIRCPHTSSLPPSWPAEWNWQKRWTLN